MDVGGAPKLLVLGVGGVPEREDLATVGENKRESSLGCHVGHGVLAKHGIHAMPININRYQAIHEVSEPKLSLIVGPKRKHTSRHTLDQSMVVAAHNLARAHAA